MKPIAIILGCLSAVLIVAQLAMGLLISRGSANLIKSHQHSGYLTVAVSLAYIAVSLTMIASIKPPPPK